MTAQPDEVVVDRIRQGWIGGHQELCRRYARLLYLRAYRLTHDHHLSEDLVQEALLRSFRSLDQLSDPRKYRAWLLRILDNVVRMWRRQAASRLATTPFPSPGSAEIPGNETEPDDAWHARAEIRRTVEAICRSLRPALRAAAHLFYVRGLSSREVADALEVPVPTVESRLFKARVEIRRMVVGKARTRAQQRIADKLLSLAQEAFVMDAIRIEISTQLIPLTKSTDPATNLLSLIGELRRELEAGHAVQLPKVHLIDNEKLSPNSYTIFVREQKVGTGVVEDLDDLTPLSESLKRVVLDHRNGLSSVT